MPSSPRESVDPQVQSPSPSEAPRPSGFSPVAARGSSLSERLLLNPKTLLMKRTKLRLLPALTTCQIPNWMPLWDPRRRALIIRKLALPAESLLLPNISRSALESAVSPAQSLPTEVELYQDCVASLAKDLEPAPANHTFQNVVVRGILAFIRSP